MLELRLHESYLIHGQTCTFQPQKPQPKAPASLHAGKPALQAPLPGYLLKATTPGGPEAFSGAGTIPKSMPNTDQSSKKDQTEVFSC